LLIKGQTALFHEMLMVLLKAKHLNENGKSNGS
jgi:hypothetical protein